VIVIIPHKNNNALNKKYSSTIAFTLKSQKRYGDLVFIFSTRSTFPKDFQRFGERLHIPETNRIKNLQPNNYMKDNGSLAVRKDPHYSAPMDG
jgi:hypothetical protein